MIRVLQTLALPLGHVARIDIRFSDRFDPVIAAAKLLMVLQTLAPVSFTGSFLATSPGLIFDFPQMILGLTKIADG